MSFWEVKVKFQLFVSIRQIRQLKKKPNQNPTTTKKEESKAHLRISDYSLHATQFLWWQYFRWYFCLTLPPMYAFEIIIQQSALLFPVSSNKHYLKDKQKAFTFLFSCVFSYLSVICSTLQNKCECQSTCKWPQSESKCPYLWTDGGEGQLHLLYCTELSAWPAEEVEPMSISSVTEGPPLLHVLEDEHQNSSHSLLHFEGWKESLD